MFSGVCKPFRWRRGKSIFPAKSKHLRNSWTSPSKTQNERFRQTALLPVRLIKGVESAFRRREWKAVSSRSCVLVFQSEWEETLYWEISASKTKTELPNRTVFNVCVHLRELSWCVFAGVCKHFLWRSGKSIFPAKSKHLRNSLNLHRKHKTNVSFKLLCWVFA